MLVEIYSDIVCPWCYIGKRRFERALDALSARYGVRTMIESRLEQLQHGRCLLLGEDDSITLLPGGQSFGRFVTGGRRLFRITSAN